MSYESRLRSVAKAHFPLALPLVVSIFMIFWDLQSLGLSHWDEFSYVATAKWFIGASNGVLTFYEPPGFPFAVAVFFRIFGVKDYVAIAVSGAFAIATVLLVTYVGLRLLGFEASLTAPILLILSPLFLTYSRMALTDIAFTFFFSLAIFLMYRAVKSGRLRDATLAGLALGACTMTKYNGFMPLIVFAFYLLITLRGIKAHERLDKLLGWLRMLFITCVPSLVLAFLYIAMLGLSAELPTSQVLSSHALKLIIFDTPSMLAKGFARLEVLAIQNHAGQLEFFPLTAAIYYLQVLLYFVPWPILFLALIGVLRKNLRDGPELFVTVWLLATIFLIASIPAQYTRAILPALPPLVLSASLGVSRLSALVQSVRFVRMRLPKLKFKVIVSLMLVLVIALSFQGAFQAVAVEHRAYREAGQLLAAEAGHSSVLAQTQPVVAFYYPVNFGQINDTSLGRDRYIIVDFIAAENGYAPVIRQLEQEGRLKLIASVPNDVPSEVYLDSISFQQLRDWNYTYIQIYQVVNGTSQSS